MKKIYFLFILVVNTLLHAQFPSYEQQLSNYNGHIIKITKNGTDYFAPSPIGQIQTSTISTINSEKRLNSVFYNTVFATIKFGENNANYFTVKDVGTTLWEYHGQNEIQVRQFDNDIFSFFTGFQPEDKFYFETILAGPVAGSFTVTNPAGNKIYYDNNLLATSETSEQKISVYPNPATDIVIIENMKPNSSLELIDNSGKLAKSISNSKATKTEINIKDLSSGIYYLKIDGQSVQKIIKK